MLAHGLCRRSTLTSQCQRPLRASISRMGFRSDLSRPLLALQSDWFGKDSRSCRTRSRSEGRFLFRFSRSRELSYRERLVSLASVGTDATWSFQSWRIRILIPLPPSPSAFAKARAHFATRGLGTSPGRASGVFQHSPSYAFTL